MNNNNYYNDNNNNNDNKNNKNNNKNKNNTTSPDQLRCSPEPFVTRAVTRADLHPHPVTHNVHTHNIHPPES